VVSWVVVTGLVVCAVVVAANTLGDFYQAWKRAQDDEIHPDGR
jgi:hypothetical protein